MATEKQVQFALSLLHRAGFGTRFMDSSFKELGATMRERSGGVQDWLRGKSAAEVSDLIKTLQARIGDK